MSAERWDRLAAGLAAGGVEAQVSARPYSEEVRGRARSGTSRSITILVPGRGLVHIGDQWWPKNPDAWAGWRVTREDAEGIVTRAWRPTKSRSDVVAAVCQALATAPGMSHRSTVPQAAARYFGAGAEHPVIREIFRPDRGWTRYPCRKRVSLSECAKLRRGGVTAVALASGGRLADFRLPELTSRARGPRDV